MKPRVVPLIFSIGLLTGGIAVAADDELYAVPPTTDVVVLAKFIERLQHFEPETAVEMLVHRRKAPDALFLAADRLVTFAKDRTSAVYRAAFPIVVSRRAQGLYLKTNEQQRKFLEEVTAFASAGEIGPHEAQAMKVAARGLEDAENSPLAAEAYASFSKLLAEHSTPSLRRLGKTFAGSLRRMELPGKPFPFGGTRMNGEKFDLAALRGKVVLVDFWATWCGPCREEFPNVRRMYEKYHDRGFEVVGLSVDEDREALETFLAKEKFPWIVLHEKETDGEHPARIEYGVVGIPGMFLIGADGNVISTHARGEELNRLLEAAFPSSQDKSAGENP